MQADIHPRYDLTTITCASCGAEHRIRSTRGDIRVDVCAECHPFYHRRRAPGRPRRPDRALRALAPSAPSARRLSARMTTYVALLRGINVGGNRKIRMTDLRDIFTEAGCGDVASYIQSGNVVFTASVVG